MEKKGRGDLKSFDINGFPKSFYFFSHFLSVSSSFQFIPTLLVFLSYAQEFALCYLPLVCDYHRKNKDTRFSSFVNFLLLYSFSPPKYQDVEPVVISLFLIVTVIVMVTVLLFILTIKGYSIPKEIIQAKGLLFLYVPSIYFSALSNNLGFCIQVFSNSTFNNLHVLINMMILILASLIIVAFTIWIDPIIVKSPIHSKSHIPSKLIPNYHFFINQTSLQVYAIAVITANTEKADIFFVIPAIFFGIYNLYSFIKLPYLSRVDTCCSLSNGTCLIIIPLIIIILQQFNYDNEVLLSLGGASIFLVSFLFFNVIIRLRERNTKFCIESGHISFSNAEEAVRFCQYAILKDRITSQLIDGISDYNRIQGSPDVLTTEVYIRLLNGREEDFNIVYQMIPPLAYDKSSSWIHRFTLYEILRQYYRGMLSHITNPDLTEINRLVACYNSTNDQFWAEILNGDINQARMKVLKAHDIYNNLRFKFFLIKSFYPDHEDIANLYNSFFWKLDIITEFGGKLSDLIIRRSYFIYIKRRQNNSQFCQRTTYFYKKLRKNLFLWEQAGFIVSAFLFLAAIIILATPGYAASDFTEPLKAVPQFIKSTQDLMTAWVSMSTAISHIENSTVFTFENCTKILHGELGHYCRTVMNLINNIKIYSQNVLDQLSHINEMFDNYSMYSDFSKAQKLWISRDIVMFKEQSSIDPLITDITQNIRTIFIYFAGNIVVKDGDIRKNESRILWPDAIVFSNTTVTILEKLGKTYGYYSSFIEFIKDKHLYLFSPELIGLFIIFSILFICMLFAIEYIHSRYYFDVYRKHFITREHPKHEGIIFDFPQIQPYKINLPVQALAISGFIVILISMMVNTFFNIFIQKAYIDGIQDTQAIQGSAIVCQLSCLLSKVLFSFWQFGNPKLLDEAYNLFRITAEKSIQVQSLLSPNYLRLFKNWIPTVLKYENISEVTQNITAHELLNSSDLFKIINTFTYGSYYGIVEGKNEQKY